MLFTTATEIHFVLGGYRHTFATVCFVATELHVQAVWQPGVCGVRQATAQHSSSVV